MLASVVQLNCGCASEDKRPDKEVGGPDADAAAPASSGTVSSNDTHDGAGDAAVDVTDSPSSETRTPVDASVNVTHAETSQPIQDASPGARDTQVSTATNSDPRSDGGVPPVDGVGTGDADVPLPAVDSGATDPVVGSVPSELVGIWQETRASAGDYMDQTGATFSITSGFSVQLKIASNGTYYLAHLASGASTTCAAVEYFEQSVGSAVLIDSSTLVLYPTERRLDVSDCTTPRSEQLDNDPIPLTIALEEDWHYYGGLRTWKMHAEGGPHAFDLTLLNREPLTDPVQPEQPSDFVLGSDPPYGELQGLWVSAEGTDSDFFDPNTGDFYFPELNGSPHQWVRFYGQAYETAVALQNTNSEGACKSDVIYYEQGLASFATIEDVGAQGNHFVGHVRLEATAGRLIVRIRECDQDDGVLQYDITPQTSYFRWIYFSPDAPPERISFPCDFPFSEWQSLLCTNFPGGFYRRE